METLAQGAIKYANQNKIPYYVLIGVGFYAIICLVLYKLYSHESMALVNAWWNIITSVTVTLSGIFIFNETLKHTDIVGIIMVIVGAFFLSADDLGLSLRGTF